MTTKNQTFKITPESYVFKFGKYKDMKAVDVAKIYTVDKNGQEQPKGMKYLEWSCAPEQNWFKHADIIQQVINNAKNPIAEPKKEGREEKIHS